MLAVISCGTSNSGTIRNAGTPGFSTGPRSKSTTSTWNSRSQRELTANQLSGKLGADQAAAPAPAPSPLKASHSRPYQHPGSRHATNSCKYGMLTCPPDQLQTADPPS